MYGTRRMVLGTCLLSASLFLASGCASHPVGSSSKSNHTASEPWSSVGYTDSNEVDPISVFDAKAVSSHPQQTTPSSPEIPIRGIIEGFYGTPWSNQERINMFQFMQRENLNAYVYAPKGDPYQRVDWRFPYPAAQLAQMKALVTDAQQDRVRFVYSISPGMTATSTSAVKASITYSSTSERKVLEAKIDELRSIGVNTFMLSFDDIETQLKPADQKVYGTNYPKAQMELVNQIFSDEKTKDPSFQLWFTPTSYYGLEDGPYWQTLRATLNQNIKVIWTGKWVLNKTITSSQAKTIAQLLGRKPILWDNYPVNDYTYNQGKHHHLMMGPLQGRDATLPNHLSGYISNPMLQPNASKLALETVADYLLDPTNYKPKADWEKSIDHMPGITNPALFKTFAEFNTTSPWSSTSYAPTGGMISAFWNASSASQRQTAENRLKLEFHKLADLPNTLPPTIKDKELLHEIQPWLTKLGKEGQGGLEALNVIDHPSQSNKQNLSQQIKLLNSSPYGIGSNIIAFMQKEFLSVKTN
ncbi:protein O-GlcNAcase [Alicyclobacillus tolerans]|uniref:protein O-GlcNAcase n=1 Tax=Alicyclobacillus tolerans TaxID=90970 RepID=UPI001F2CF70C|nr:protein O-GlcNAcase [Alicyclobacillus tolerans]MCF8568288.1 protein O-GlcNAcase [Alicyclobacillus tolerans]